MERLHEHDCRNLGPKIANLERLTVRQWPYIFPLG